VGRVGLRVKTWLTVLVRKEQKSRRCFAGRRLREAVKKIKTNTGKNACATRKKIVLDLKSTLSRKIGR
jgi:hypothetical protein